MKRFFLKNILYFFICIVCFIAVMPAWAGAQEAMQVAETLFLQEHYWQAIDAFQDAIKEHPDDSDLVAQADYFTGACYVHLFDFLTAKKNFETVVGKYKESPYYEDAYLALGDIEFLRENFQEALDVYYDFLSENPGNKRMATVYFRLAEINARLGRKDEFKKYMGKLQQEFPESFESKDARRLLASDEFYTVQVGAFTDYDNAEKFISQLDAKGYKVHSVLCMLAGKKLCRIRVGKYRTMDEAKELKKRLQADGYFAKILPQ
ncbi:MAG: SPOR domain-containing protein [Candidatus Omnitrophota bacterium]